MLYFCHIAQGPEDIEPAVEKQKHKGKTVLTTENKKSSET